VTGATVSALAAKSATSRFLFDANTENASNADDGSGIFAPTP
jgi:hypothetical protein